MSVYLGPKFSEVNLYRCEELIEDGTFFRVPVGSRPSIASMIGLEGLIRNTNDELWERPTTKHEMILSKACPLPQTYKYLPVYRF